MILDNIKTLYNAYDFLVLSSIIYLFIYIVDIVPELTKSDIGTRRVSNRGA